MSRKPEGPVKTCEECGASFRVPPSRANTARFCSRKCKAPHTYDGKGTQVTLECAACGKPFTSPRSHADRRVYCSYECKDRHAGYRSRISMRTKGHLNAQWRGGRTKHSDGYFCQLAPHHPYASNGYVFEHRLVMEQWLRENEPTSPYLVQHGWQLYLSPEYHVHHKDEDKANNAVDNLQCVTPSEHSALHVELRRERART